LSKPELGVKRVCGNCGAKFYDLNKDPAVCPTCDTAFVPAAPSRSRPHLVAVRPSASVKPVKETVVPAAEFISIPKTEKAEGHEEDDDLDEGLNGARLVAADDEDEVLEPDEEA